MNDDSHAVPNRTSPGKFAFALAWMVFATAIYTYSAFSGGPDWQRDAYCAIGLWALLALLVTHHFYWYKLPKSSRLIVAGLWGVGMGALLVAAAALLLRPIHAATPVFVILAGAFLVLRGLWTRRQERNTTATER